MDLATLIGVVSGIGFIIGTILMGSSLVLFINMPSMLIVGGGTMAATLIAYPLNEFLMVLGLALKVFIFKIEKTEDLVKKLVDISNKARKGGLLSIEGDIKKTKDPYLANALQMSVDGAKTSDIAR